MSFDNQMCMLSNTPVRPETKVKLYFLVSDGPLNKPLYQEKVYYPWDTCKILGSVSLEAIYKEYNQFSIIENEKSRYILSLLKEDQENEELNFDKIFEQLSDGFIKINKTTNKNAYISIGVIHKDIYEQMVSVSKNNYDKVFEKQYEEYIDFRDNDAQRIYRKTYTPEEYEKEKDFINEMRVGFIKEYTFNILLPDTRNAFATLKKQNSLSDKEAFSLISDDMHIVHILYECSMPIAPKSVNDVHSDSSLRKALFNLAQEKLYNDESFELVKPLFKVKVTQEVSISQLKEIFKKDYFTDELKALEDFEKQHSGKDYITLTGENEINQYIFLEEFIEQTDVELIIKFD